MGERWENWSLRGERRVTKLVSVIEPEGRIKRLLSAFSYVSSLLLNGLGRKAAWLNVYFGFMIFIWFAPAVAKGRGGKTTSVGAPTESSSLSV